jgi:hypothetical protein
MRESMERRKAKAARAQLVTTRGRPWALCARWAQGKRRVKRKFPVKVTWTKADFPAISDRAAHPLTHKLLKVKSL